MRRAFVVQLGPDTKPEEGQFEGWVQEVDTCCEERFRSTQELLEFLGERFDLTEASGGNTSPNDSEAAGVKKKNSRKGKKSS